MRLIQNCLLLLPAQKPKTQNLLNTSPRFALQHPIPDPLDERPTAYLHYDFQRLWNNSDECLVMAFECWMRLVDFSLRLSSDWESI